MFQKNELAYLRKSLAAELLKLFFEEKLIEEVNKIPVKRVPKNTNPKRCCIYKDRAMLRYRLMSLMGVNLETEDNEHLSLSDFAKKALKRTEINSKVLTIIDIACASCQQNKYVITDMCKGCEARPCAINCPKNAISFTNQKAHIEQEKCISCGKCAEVCPYHAVITSPVPCEEACPVGAIIRNPKTGKEEIDFDKCIYCGQCTRACPFGTIMERSQILDVAVSLKNKRNTTVAMLAPSIIGQFPGEVTQIITALKILGFDKVYEVAFGADITAKNEAKEFIHKMKMGENMLGTSCCPAYVESVKKHVPEFAKFVSNTKTPMSYTAEEAKRNFPNSTIVFIGPCIAKKFEGTHDDNVDFVLTFEELAAFILAKNIEISDLPHTDYDTPKSTIAARKFCTDGGVAEAVKFYATQEDENIEINPLYINGLDKKGLQLLKIAAQGKLKQNLIECMSCKGGCLNGPGVIVPPNISKRKLNDIK